MKDVSLDVTIILIGKSITVKVLNPFNPLRECFVDIVNPSVVLALK